MIFAAIMMLVFSTYLYHFHFHLSLSLSTYAYPDIQAWRELGLIVIVVAITMLMFSTLLFAFESDGPAPEVATFFRKSFDFQFNFFLQLCFKGWSYNPNS